MKLEDIERLRAQVIATSAVTWTVGSTPADRDFAARAPADRPSATLFSDDLPIATFWSYLHNGPQHANYIAWIGRNAYALLSGELNEQSLSEGLELFGLIPLRFWSPGPTPWYLCKGFVNTLTLRSNQHTEEIATVWDGDKNKEIASLCCWFVDGGADLLALSHGGAGHVVSTMLPALASHYRKRLDDDVEGAVLALAERAGHLPLPISSALAAVVYACEAASWERPVVSASEVLSAASTRLGIS